MRQTKTRVLALMCVAMLLGYMPWYSFSAVAKYLVQDFNLGAGQMGAILSVFQVGYVLIVVFTGWLADRIGPRRVVAWATLCAALSSTAFLFLARGFTSILVLRLAVGLSCGAIYAPGMAFLSSWFAPKERGKALGAYTAALTAAYAGGYLVAAPLAATYGWRAGMLGTSIPVFVAAFIVFLLVRDHPEEGSSQPGSGVAKTVDPSSYGGTRRTLLAAQILISLAYMGHMWELYAFWGWIGPYYVANVFHAGYAEAQAVSIGGMLSALVIFAGVPAVWAIGSVSDRVGRLKSITIAAFCSLVVQCTFGFLFGKPLELVVLVGLWLGFWVIADSGIYKAGLTELVNADRRSLALGLQSAAGFSLTIIAPMAFGNLLEAANGKGVDPTTATSWGLPFLVLGLGALLSPLAVLVLRKLPEARLLAKAQPEVAGPRGTT